MVNIQKYISSSGIQSKSRLPLLNSMFVQRFSAFSPLGQDLSFKTYMKWARRSPQVMGFVNIIATDILSDNVSFEAIEDSSSGRNKIKKSEAFWNANRGLEIAEETIYDLLLNGIGYNWIGKLNEVQIKEFCDVVARELYDGGSVELKSRELYGKVINHNTADIARKLRYIPASTMTIHANEYEPIEYIQRVGVNIKTYNPDEIIAFKLMPLDGKLYPFPPMEAILSEVYLLWLITQNYVSFFENGGHPDKVFILPKEIANSKNHQFMIDTLKKYKKVQNKHGNMVFTGELQIEDLMKVESQMENKELGLYLVGVLAMMYGVPVGRIPFLVGKAANMGDAGGLADGGYWRKISVWQSKLEAGWNNYLWKPFFGTKIKFARGYKQDEVRETQNEVQKNSVVEQRIELGLWTMKEAGKYLHIDEEIINQAQKEKEKRDEKIMNKSSKMGDNMRNVIPNQDNRLKAKQKQNTQLNNNDGGKKINP